MIRHTAEVVVGVRRPRWRKEVGQRSLSAGDGIAARWPDERPPSPVDGLGGREAAWVIDDVAGSWWAE